METNESTQASRSRSLNLQPSSQELGTSSQPFASNGGSSRSTLTAATTAAAVAASAAASAAAVSSAASTAKTAALTKSAAPFSSLTESSSDSPHDAAYAGSHQKGHGNLGFEPIYVSRVAQDPCTTTDLNSGSGPVPGASSGHITVSTSAPVPGSDSGPGYGSTPGSSSAPGRGSGSGSGPGHVSILDPASGPSHGSDPSSSSHPGHSSGPGSSSGPGHGSGSGPGHGFAVGSGQGSRPDSSPGPASGAGPGSGPGPVHRPSTPQKLQNLGSDLPNYISWNQQCHWEPQKQPPWKPLQVSEPGVRGPWKPPKVEGKSKYLCEMLPRGQCLLYNWEEERATNHLDQVPSSQDGSESFFFRHGHRGLLTMQLQSPMSSSTTQKDSYRPPADLCQPLRGKREAMLEMFLHHQICKEVQAEQEPRRKLFDAESVTHHDYRMELVKAGPPAPTKPHDYRQEQPETFWLQRAPQLPGVSNIRTLDTPFRKNCSFSTPVPLSLGQPLPYEPESYPHQLGELSSLACQGERQGCQGGRTTPV